MGASTLGDHALEFFSFKYDFMVNALLGATSVGALCGVVGVFLVLRGLALVGDATGHATLPGVCVAFLIVGSKAVSALLAGALVAGLLASWAVGVFSRGPRVRPDAALGIVLSVFFGLGIVLLSYVQNDPSAGQAGLNTFLFGNVASISREQVTILSAITAVTILAVFLFFRPLLLCSFDPGFARSMGIPCRAVELCLLLALAVAVVCSIQAVGVVLVSAMLIIPPSTALFWSKRLATVTALSASFGVAAGAVGAFLSYLQAGLSTGPTMVLMAFAFFVISLLVGSRGGVLRRPRPTTTSVEES